MHMLSMSCPTMKMTSKSITSLIISICLTVIIITSSGVKSFQLHHNSASSLNTNSLNNLKMKSGGHAENFRFLSVVRGSDEMHYPRIVPVAGKVEP